MEMYTAGGSSPQFMVESPPERLSPSNQQAFRDDLSPVTDLPQSKRKVAINIGASPSGFILEEDEEEEEEENDEELEVVDARMFRPIVEPQSSVDQPTDEPDVLQEHVPDLGGEGTGQPLEVVIGEASLCDGPGEVSDDEGAGSPENFEKVEMSDVAEVLEAEMAAGALEHEPQGVAELHFDSAGHDVPDTELLIDFEDTEVGGQPPCSEHHEGPAADDEEDLPPPPPEQNGDDQ